MSGHRRGHGIHVGSVLRHKFGNNAKNMNVDEDMLDPEELEQIAKVGGCYGCYGCWVDAMGC